MEADLAQIRGRRYRSGGDAFEVGYTRQDDSRTKAASLTLVSIIAMIVGIVIVIGLLSFVFSSATDSGSDHMPQTGTFEMESEEFDEYFGKDWGFSFDGWGFSTR